MLAIEVRHLLLVKTVADEGSLAAAARVLNLTPSALSHQLHDIEQRLGTPLFHRVGKKMRVSTAGERFLASARGIVDVLERVEEEIRMIATGARGVLRITTECFTCYHWLPLLLRRFERKHPSVEVRVDTNATNRAIDALLEGSVDLVIASSVITDRRLRVTPLFEDELLAIMASDHRLADRAFLSPKDFATETLLTYGPLDDNTFYQRVLHPAGVEPGKWMQVALTEAMIELARGGIGIAVAPRWSVWPQLESGVVAGVPVMRRGLHRQWKAVCLRSQTPRYLDDFIGILAESSPSTRLIPLHVPRRIARRA